MRDSLLDHLVDPWTNEPLHVVERTAIVAADSRGWARCSSWCGRSAKSAESVSDETCNQCLSEEVETGTIGTKTGRSYPIVRGVPRLLSDAYLRLVENLPKDWLARYRPLGALTLSEHDAAQITTATAFGEEWRFFSTQLPDYEPIARSYFDLLEDRDFAGVTLDAGCGMGRWARHAAQRSGCLMAVDLSGAVDVARRTLAGLPNTHVVQADVHALPFRHESFDLVYSLGVLHHVPQPEVGVAQVARHVRPGGRLLGYFYYAFDNRPWFYRALIPFVSVLRQIIARLPHAVARWVCFGLTVGVYLPLIGLGRLLSCLGFKRLARHVPLYEFYADKRFVIIFNDTVDRFATAVEYRYTQEQLRAMYRQAGLDDVRFSATTPFWKVIGIRAQAVQPCGHALELKETVGNRTGPMASRSVRRS